MRERIEIGENKVAVFEVGGVKFEVRRTRTGVGLMIIPKVRGRITKATVTVQPHRRIKIRPELLHD